MTHQAPPDGERTVTTASQPEATALRREIRSKYSEVATNPDAEFHFINGRPMAERLGYPMDLVDAMPAAAVASFSGVANPFSAGALSPGQRVLDVGCGAGFDCFIASPQVGETGQVIGVDMTEPMLEKARLTAEEMGLSNVEFRSGYAEELPVEDASVDVVISNGVINLCPDKRRVFQETFRVLKPGGRLQIADVVVHKNLPEAARANVDLWTA